jgi:aryl-alcohol dehydrogenase-like predicted oxidoreductase
MIRGTPREQERAVARALELGITYFDTAPSYGNGESETNLGEVLAKLRPHIFLSTKFSIRSADRGNIPAAIATSVETSLRRLDRERIDLLQLHNAIGADDGDYSLPPDIVLGEIAAALDGLRRQGKILFFGITAVGETPALHSVVEARQFDTAQVPYNLLNPTATHGVPRGFPAHDFAELLGRARAVGMGTIGIRILAAGALSGVEERHPYGVAEVATISSGPDYRTDVRHAHLFEPLVRAGYADSLVELALRFAITEGGPSTVLLGVSDLEQLNLAAALVQKGPLPPKAMDLIANAWRSMASEDRRVRLP